MAPKRKYSSKRYKYVYTQSDGDTWSGAVQKRGKGRTRLSFTIGTWQTEEEAAHAVDLYVSHFDLAPFMLQWSCTGVLQSLDRLDCPEAACSLFQMYLHLFLHAVQGVDRPGRVIARVPDECVRGEAALGQQPEHLRVSPLV